MGYTLGFLSYVSRSVDRLAGMTAHPTGIRLLVFCARDLTLVQWKAMRVHFLCGMGLRNAAWIGMVDSWQLCTEFAQRPRVAG